MRRAVVALFAIALASCGRTEAGYPPQYELNFVRACEAQGAPGEICRCIWGKIATEIPRTDFDALERMPAAQRASSPTQHRIEDLAKQCAREPTASSSP